MNKTYVLSIALACAVGTGYTMDATMTANPLVLRNTLYAQERALCEEVKAVRAQIAAITDTTSSETIEHLYERDFQLQEKVEVVQDQLRAKGLEPAYNFGDIFASKVYVADHASRTMVSPSRARARKPGPESPTRNRH